MNYGPLIFLAAFLALSASWFGFVLTPQIQLGRQGPQTNMVDKAQLYPQGRPGLARQGLDVYRAHGCAACHSQQVRQTGVVVDVVLKDAGPNPVGLAEALVQANVGITNATGPGLAGGLPKTLFRGITMDVADVVMGTMKALGAKAETVIVPVGPDIARGWGGRRTVAADFLADYPVMLGSQRVGHDLANVGVRKPDASWHLRHLYAPRSAVKDSPMPPYRFLFEQRKLGPGQKPSPDALQLPADFAPPAGFEIVPKPEARALAAYLLSLRADVPLFEAPMTASAPAKTADPATNAPGTNAPPK